MGWGGRGILLAGWQTGSSSASCLTQLRTTCLGHGVTHSGLGPPISINSTMPTDTLTGQSDLGNSSTEVLPPDNSRLCQADNQNYQNRGNGQKDTVWKKRGI